jgi:hypothetical protein
MRPRRARSRADRLTAAPGEAASPRLWLSSSAQADDPVIMVLSVFTGSPAFAGDDSGVGNPKPDQPSDRRPSSSWAASRPAQDDGERQQLPP